MTVSSVGKEAAIEMANSILEAIVTVEESTTSVTSNAGDLATES